VLDALSWSLAVLSAGAGVYCVLVAIAASRYLSEQPPSLAAPAPLSVLKPLAGVDDGLEENLRSFFEQDYPSFELLIAVRAPADPAVPLVERLQREYPHISARLLFVGEPPYANAKVWSLERMTAEAQHDLLVMSDSDIRVTPAFLRTIAAEFTDPLVGVTTCPYRAVPGRTFASTTEAIGMNTEFLAGVLVARLLEGMKFALGPTLSARKRTIEDAGGWPFLAEFLAEDFVLGQKAAAKGWRVLMSSYVIEHRIGGQSFSANARHRVRWYRSTRRSRPAGYVGQVFTNPLPLVLPLLLLQPTWAPFLMLIVLLRILAAVATAGWVLKDPLTARRWWLLPVQDLLSFVFWIAGFFGNTIQWRGRTYYLLPDGRFRLVQDVTAPAAQR
jgi:ceramide glucosyltransferase